MKRKKLKQRKPISLARRTELGKILEALLRKDDMDMSTLLLIYKDKLKEELRVTAEEAEWIRKNLIIEPASIIQK